MGKFEYMGHEAWEAENVRRVRIEVAGVTCFADLQRNGDGNSFTYSFSRAGGEAGCRRHEAYASITVDRNGVVNALPEADRFVEDLHQMHRRLWARALQEFGVGRS